jgi:ComF family protein
MVVRPARTAFHGLISFVLPDDCRICGLPLTKASRIPVCDGCLHEAAVPFEAEYLCSRCRSPFLNRESLTEEGLCPACSVEPEGFDTAWGYGSYDGALRRLIHVYKYEKVDTLAVPLARLLCDALPRDEEEFDLITPMPLHWRKRWDRGFNQSELLAREVSRRTGIEYRDLLQRVKASPAQAGLTFAARLKNVQGVFRLRGEKPRGLHVLLIDDVLTTGATVSAAARVLKRSGGARRISILTVARADRRHAWKQPRVSAATTS